MKQMRSLLLPVVFMTLSQAYKVHSSHEPPAEVPLYRELAAAIPFLSINMTNMTGLISDRGAPQNRNITYHFGDLASDLALLSDKVSGFYAILHEMLGDKGPELCPINKQSRIKECMLMALCFLEEHVPEDIELEQYTTYIEVVQRFIDIGWPVLKKGLLFEETNPVLQEDGVAPAEYQCDLLKHPTEPVGNAVSLVGLKASAAKTLAASAALTQASKTTHEVLDAHKDSALVDATVQKLHQVWHPVCKDLGCDHSNFWDVHFASHKQTLALLKLGSAPHVRTEIQQRLRLEQRVLRFVEENAGYFGTIRNSSSPGRKFIDPAFIQASSRKAFQRYASKGRDSLLRFIFPTMRELASTNQTRALRLLDQVEFRKFQQRQALAHQDLHEEEHEDLHEEEHEEDHEELEKADDDGESDEAEDEPMYLQVESGDEVDAEVEGDAEGGRRRRRNRRRSRRRRWIGGRRRRRRRRRIFEAAFQAVAKVVEDVVEFMAQGLACIGTAAEFSSTGYSYEVVPGAVSLNIGLSSGSSQSLDNLMKGQMPQNFVSVDFGFAVGITAKLTWSGVGLGGGVGCNVDGCGAYISVAAIGSINIPTPVAAGCPFGATVGAATCAQAFGGGISTMCCNMDLRDGSNDCR